MHLKQNNQIVSEPGVRKNKWQDNFFFFFFFFFFLFPFRYILKILIIKNKDEKQIN